MSVARHVVALSLLCGALASARAEAPFVLEDARGRVIDLGAPAAALSSTWREEPLGGLPHPGDLAPAAPRRARQRRGWFARLFGVSPTPPPLGMKYPVVLVHGANTPKELHAGPVKLRYFAKTEAHLRRLGLRLLVPEVNPFGSIEERAGQLEAQILAAIPEGKFNIVAHSMGGLDARYLASHRPIGARIASVTTVATPHHGAWYADFAETWVFERQGLNWLGGLFGLRFDQIPDLTVRHMEGTFNPSTPDNPEVTYFSYGTATSVLGSPPHFWGMNLITRLMERRAARKARRAAVLEHRHARGRVRLAPAAATTMARALEARDAGWVVPKWAGRNDGVVSLSSSVWGEYLGTVRTHHWGPMGWISMVKEYKLWEEICRMLAARGF